MRNTEPDDGAPDILGEDYWRGRSLVEATTEQNIEYVPGATVWTAETNPLTVGYMEGDRSFLRAAQYVVIATGAYERPVPISGWTLPGVMTAGAAQILMKAEGAALTGPIVLAGSGPLLQLVTCQLLRSGTEIAGLLETTTTRDYLAAAPHLLRAAGASDLLRKGLKMRRTIRKSGIPIYSAVRNMRCNGADKFESISFESGGKTHQIKADLLLLHEGVIPHVQISRLLNLSHEWVEPQRYWRPEVNKWGETSSDRVLVAGDGAGIDGALAAETSGRLAALHAAAELRALSPRDRDLKAAPLFARKKQDRRIRPLLDHLYRPSEEIICPSDPSTIVCRCEEVKVQEIHDCIETGCDGPNQLKAYSRCGMGPCQGRLCGLSVTQLLAEANEQSCDETGYYHIRQPLKPITLGELAAMEEAVGIAELEFEK